MLLSTLSLVACLFLSTGRISGGRVIVSIDALSYLPLFVLGALTAVLTFMDIFLFSKRALQMRIMSFTLILILGWYILYGFQIYSILSGTEGMSYHPEIGAALPFAALVFNYLAFRGILKDEMLVRSLDRLR